MAFQKKPTNAETATEEPKKFGGAKGVTDSKRYEAPLAYLRTLKEQIDTIEAGLEASAKDVAGAEEERRQEGATYAFNLKLARDQQTAEFLKQDAERVAIHAARESALTIAEGDFAELLGVEITPGEHLATGKLLRTTLESKLKEQFEDGKKEGAASAAASYNISKKIDAAEAKTALALLEQKVAQLETANAELKAQNQKLLDAQTKTNEAIADVAKTGLSAAAGITKQANDALGSAAGTFPGGSRTTR